MKTYRKTSQVAVKETDTRINNVFTKDQIQSQAWCIPTKQFV